MFTSRFLPLAGGVETHVDEVSRRLVAKGIDVTVLTADSTGHLPHREERHGVVVRRFPIYPRRGDIYVSPALMREIRAGPYDLVHVQGLTRLLPPLVIRAAERRGVPTVVTFHTGGHSSRWRMAIRGSQRRAVAPLLRRADALVAISKGEEQIFRQALGPGGPPLSFIRNGAEALPVGQVPDGLTGSPLVVSVARLERFKGHHRLIEAMPALCRTTPAPHLVIVGRGPYDGRLHRLAKKLGVQDCVTFTSFEATQRAELGALLGACDVFALMSDYEGHPIAVLEALAAGCKVVVSSSPGLDELAAYENVDTLDTSAGPDELADLLKSAAAKPRGSAPVLPSWDECVEELLDLYRQVVSSSGRSAGR